MDWLLADAKNRFSELVTKALEEGPQRVRRRDQVVIVLAESDYARLRGERPSLRDYLLSGSDLRELDLERDKSPMREVTW